MPRWSQWAEKTTASDARSVPGTRPATLYWGKVRTALARSALAVTSRGTGRKSRVWALRRRASRSWPPALTSLRAKASVTQPCRGALRGPEATMNFSPRNPAVTTDQS